MLVLRPTARVSRVRLPSPGVFEPVPVLYRYEPNLVRRVVMAENARRGPEEFTVPRPT